MTPMIILGAPDPEMQLIEALGRQAGAEILYALAGGERVRPDTAYRADALSAPIPPLSTVIAVECDGPAIPAGAIRVDHHRPGDPGYGRPPAEFLPASSLGQAAAALARIGVCGWRRHTPVAGNHYPDAQPGDLVCHRYYRGLYWSIVIDCPPDDEDDPAAGLWWAAVPQEYMLAAAADHCLAAAYRGECPGVEPDALMRWRVETRAAHQRRSTSAILADIDRARQALRAAPRVDIGGDAPVADLRGQAIPELPEAAAREGIAFLATPLPRAGERPKVVLQAASPEQVEAFLDSWAPAQGLVDLYGDPARGFAGGYKE